MLLEAADLPDLDSLLDQFLPAAAIELRPTIHQALCQNLRSGRARRYIQLNSLSGLPAYIPHLADMARQEAERRQGLLEAGEDPWQWLARQLQADASRRLRRCGLPETEAQTISEDLAQEACLIILRRPYPLDVPYLPWARRILLNCLRYRFSRSPARRECVSPLADLTEDWSLPDESIDFAEASVEQQTIAWALARLTDGQRRVMERSLAGWPLEAIAAETGRSPQAIYNLKHRALKEMQALIRESLEAAERPPDPQRPARRPKNTG